MTKLFQDFKPSSLAKCLFLSSLYSIHPSPIHQILSADPVPLTMFRREYRRKCIGLAAELLQFELWLLWPLCPGLSTHLFHSSLVTEPVLLSLEGPPTSFSSMKLSMVTLALSSLFVALLKTSHFAFIMFSSGWLVTTYCILEFDPSIPQIHIKHNYVPDFELDNTYAS